MKKLLFSGHENSFTSDIALALLRVFAGLALAFGHGLSKLPPSEGFINRTAEMGFPIPTLFAYSASYSEFFGALLLAAGLFTRPAAFFVSATMFVAAFIGHADDPFGRAEKAYLYLALGLIYLVIGSGRFSMDSLFRRKLNL
jgi:putative oxidoreductase